MDSFQKEINYYKESSERDFKTAEDLFKTKHYDACLFFCHLALEKILKGLLTKISQEPSPFTHDLAKLAKLSNLDLTNEQIKNLKIISDFNIARRYENYKYDFYKICTKEYTSNYLEISKSLLLWIKKSFKKSRKRNQRIY